MMNGTKSICQKRIMDFQNQIFLVSAAVHDHYVDFATEMLVKQANVNRNRFTVLFNQNAIENIYQEVVSE